MICPECQTDLSEDAVYCHACGKRVAGGLPKRSRRLREDNASRQSGAVRSPQKRRKKRRSVAAGHVDDNGGVALPGMEGLASNGASSNRFRKARRQLQELTPNDEEIELWSGTYSAKGMVNYWLFAVLLSVFVPIGVAVVASGQGILPFVAVTLLLMWLILGGMLVFQKLDVHYELTNQRLVHKVGILRRITNRIEVIDIDDVTFEQGIIERFIGVGSIAIYSSDRTDPSIVMSGIDDVLQVAELVDEARRAERVRRGIHIEAV